MIDQIGIFVLGVAAVILTNQRAEKVRRWAPICGFAAEPFWFYTGFVNDQWGIVGLAFIYGAAWGQGIYYSWFRKDHENTQRTDQENSRGQAHDREEREARPERASDHSADEHRAA